MPLERRKDGTHALVLDEKTRMGFARTLARAASCLDDLRSPTASQQMILEAKHEAQALVPLLHDIASVLAGNLTHEVYDQDEAERVIAASGVATVAETA